MVKVPLLQAVQELCNTKWTVETKPVYEHRDIWGEEASALNTNSGEWSHGNGSVGLIGMPFNDGWEIVAMGFHADTFPSTATVRVAIHDHSQIASNAVANDLASISLNGATDGGGQINNAYKYEEFSTPVAVPAGALLGFITRGVTGNIVDARVYARLRRKQADVVCAVLRNGIALVQEN